MISFLEISLAIESFGKNEFLANFFSPWLAAGTVIVGAISWLVTLIYAEIDRRVRLLILWVVAFGFVIVMLGILKFLPFSIGIALNAALWGIFLFKFSLMFWRDPKGKWIK